MFNLLSQLNPFNLIPPQYTLWAKAIAYLIAAVFVFGLGWSVNGWRLNAKYQREELNRQEAIAEAQKEAQDKISEADQKYVKDLANAKKTIDGLRYCISHGTCRVSIGGKPMPTTNSTGISHAAPRCELSQASANDLISIAEDGDNAIIQLTACQNILRGR